MTALTEVPSETATGAVPVIEAGSPRDRAERAWWDVTEGLRLWRLWGLQSHKEVRRRYRRTVLGPAWVTVSLLIFAGALSFVWSALWKLNAAEFLPFLLSGLLPWTLIASSIGESGGVFVGGEGMMKSRDFPFSVLIYTALARNVVVLGHNLIAYFIVAVACGVPIGAPTLLLLPGLALTLINCTWMCLVVAVCCLRFRDFQQIVGSLLQMAVFVTPIFWAAGQLTGAKAIIVKINLLHHMVDVIRQPLLGHVPSLVSYLVGATGAIVGSLFAYRLFAAKRHRLTYWF